MSVCSRHRRHLWRDGFRLVSSFDSLVIFLFYGLLEKRSSNLSSPRPAPFPVFGCFTVVS